MDRKEFEQMAPRLRERIVGMVESMSADADGGFADDVAQDTLLKLWTIRDRLDEYRSVDSLALVIARHRAIDLLRGSQTDSLDSLPRDIGEAAPSPEQEIIRSEEHDSVMAIIASLPSVQQAVIRMKHIEGLEVAEIAAITGSTAGSVRVALSRARQSIKDLFMKQHQL